jgi:cellulose synthase (UDP-forming)
MQKTSFSKASLFVAAIAANLYYLRFIFTPAHAGQRLFWLVTAIADAVVAAVFVSTWATALSFELGKARYGRALAALRRQGRPRGEVAVLVTVVDEDPAVVAQTLQSALNLVGSKTVYLLDDGKSDATRRLAARLGVRYVRRSGRDGYKAGNINNALRFHVREPFAIIVDADFALRPEFIERTLPLFADPRVAAVQTPQVYGNADTLFSRGCQHLQDIFYRYLQPGKDLARASFCVGTNVIFRVSALREVGGLREMHSEDIFTTVGLLERGHQVRFLNEELAVGLSPTTLESVYTQQNRWARGAFLMMLKHNTLLNPKLTWPQRLQFFASNFFYFSGVSMLVYLASPAVAIALNISPYSAHYFRQWLVAYGLFAAFNFGLPLVLMRKHRLAACILSTFLFVPYLAALFSTLVGRRPFQWRVTHARSGGLVARLLAPLVLLLGAALTLGCLTAMHLLAIHRTLAPYYAWLLVDVLAGGALVARGVRGVAESAHAADPVPQGHQGHISPGAMSDALVGGSGKPEMMTRPG